MEEISYVVMQLFVLLTMALIMGRIFERFKLPGLVGEIIVGILFINICICYPSFAENIHFDPISFESDHTHFLNIMGELGIIFLLFTVGLETRFSDLMKVGRPALYVALLGIIVPFVFGFLFGSFLNYDANVSILIGTAMFAMSTAITIEVLRNINAMGSKEAKIIIAAAVIDDILCLSLLAIISGIVDPHTTNAAIITNTMIVIAFLLIAFTSISRIKNIADRRKIAKRARKAELMMKRGIEPNESELDSCDILSAKSATALAIIVCLGMATMSSIIGLAGIIGAFLAGMVFAEFRDTVPCEKNFQTLTEFLLPFFFIFVGMEVKFDMISVSILGLLACLVIVAIATKYVGGYVGGRLGKLSKRSSELIGMSMIPRGEVGIIVAAIGLKLQVFDDTMFTAVILMTMITSIVAPPLISWSYKRMTKKSASSDATTGSD